ncbi:uncharacterized protein LOC131952923 [Physella acuta]|uniref:uncharacterized protein LOC131952923 n=1 Tax=Physella acuta TaxID=109671 RepID=UPI0027DBECA8|nr:uncharacterized protein LOC131952923 [Physella acuta]
MKANIRSVVNLMMEACKEKNLKESAPPCQHRKATLFESFLMDMETISKFPLADSFFIFFLLVVSIFCACLESMFAVGYLQKSELLNENECMLLKFIVWSTFFWPALFGHLAILQQFTRAIIREENLLHRNPHTLTSDQEEIRIGDQRNGKDKNLKNSRTLKLDCVIRRYAWEQLIEESCEHISDFLVAHKKYFTYEVDWSALTFKHKVTKLSPKVKDGTVIKTQRGDIQTGTQWVPLWACYYDNQTDCKQGHAFRGSRGTTTWVEVDLDQCYSINRQVQLCALRDLPQRLKMDIEIVKFPNLTKVKGEVFQKVQNWHVDSLVEVEPSSRAHAQLLARQECSVVEFEIRTTLSNPKGELPVKFTYNKRDISFVSYIKDLHEAFQLVKDGGVLRPKEMACVELIEEKWLDKDGVEHSTSHPQIITRGTCVCLNWTDQRVDIKTSPLSMDESTSDGDHNMNKTPINHTEENPSVNSIAMVD